MRGLGAAEGSKLLMVLWAYGERAFDISGAMTHGRTERIPRSRRLSCLRTAALRADAVSTFS